MSVILVVDDHPGNVVPLVKLFRFNGVEAAPAYCGRDALALLDASGPQVVLLDVMMPDMDGYEVLAAIRAERRYDAIAVLMYSAITAEEAKARARELGAQGYIVKGTPFQGILVEVRAHLPAR